MKFKLSFRYTFSEWLLDLLSIAIMGILEWHFVLVLQRGSVTVLENSPQLLFFEANIMIPFTFVFGLYKLIEDIVLVIRNKRCMRYIVFELGLDIFFLLSVAFIGYHFREIVYHGQSVIDQDNLRILYSILVLIPVTIAIGIYKFWEDIIFVIKRRPKN